MLPLQTLQEMDVDEILNDVLDLKPFLDMQRQGICSRKRSILPPFRQDTFSELRSIPGAC